MSDKLLDLSLERYLVSNVDGILTYSFPVNITFDFMENRLRLLEIFEEVTIHQSRGMSFYEVVCYPKKK